jgi:hypothetical protein
VHLLCVFVLPYSNWHWVTVCLSESIAAMRKGVPRAFRIAHDAIQARRPGPRATSNTSGSFTSRRARWRPTSRSRCPLERDP